MGAVVMAIASMALVSCGSGSREPDAERGTPPDRSAEACELLDRFGEVGEALGRRSVADRSADELDDLLSQRRDAARHAVEVVDEGDAAVLSRFLEESEVADAALVRLWEANRDRVPGIGRTWDWVLIQSANEEERAGYFAARTDRAMVYDVLAENCGTTELPVAEEASGAEPIEAGVLGFVTLGGSQELGFADTADGAVAPLGLPEGAAGATTLDVSPDGLQIAVNGWGADGARIDVFTPESGFRTWAKIADAAVECATWRADGSELLVVLLHRAGGSEVVSLDANGTATPVSLPGTWGGCAVEVAPGLVVGTQTDDVWDEPRPAMTVVGAGTVQRLDAPPECNTVLGGVSPDGAQAALAATCADPVDTGLWVTPLDGGEANHLVAGHAAVPEWSRSGAWIVFGFAPNGSDLRDGIEVWGVRSDGGSLQRVIDQPSSFPAWTAYLALP